VSIHPRSDRAIYQQIADQLRAQILRTGELPPGARLPSERELMERYDTTRATVRQALRVLQAEGLIDSRRGAGAYVRERGPVRRVSLERFARKHRDAGKAAFVIEAEQQGRSWSQELLELGETPAPQPVAARLGVEEGEAVFVRRRLMLMDNVPLQYADSYFRLDDVQGTQITERDSGPGGVYARLEEQGHRLTRFSEELSFRMPTPDEAHGLHLGPGVPVIDLIRTAYADDHAVEVFTAVMAGDKHVFQYDFPAE